MGSDFGRVSARFIGGPRTGVRMVDAVVAYEYHDGGNYVWIGEAGGAKVFRWVPRGGVAVEDPPMVGVPQSSLARHGGENLDVGWSERLRRMREEPLASSEEDEIGEWFVSNMGGANLRQLRGLVGVLHRLSVHVRDALDFELRIRELDKAIGG